jgi:hypothetical protein
MIVACCQDLLAVKLDCKANNRVYNLVFLTSFMHNKEDVAIREKNIFRGNTTNIATAVAMATDPAFA